MQVGRVYVAFGVIGSCLPAKSQLTKANQTKTKMENLARELQKASATMHVVLIFILTARLPPG